MKESRQSFLVGLFVLAGLLALAILIVLFGQYGFWTRSAEAYVLNAIFPRAPGIRSGTIVTIGGLQVGRVFDVHFRNRADFEEGVIVAIAFDEGITLREGTLARTSEPGLGMGRPPITIQPGSADASILAPGADITGKLSPAMESFIPQTLISNFSKTSDLLGDAAEALTPVLRDLHEVLQPRAIEDVDQPGGLPGNLSTAMVRLDEGLKHFNDVLGDPEVKSQLRESVANIHSLTEDGKVALTDMKEAVKDARTAASKANTLIDKTNNAVARIDQRVDEVARTMTDDLELASRVLTRMDILLEKAGRGEGTIGRLFTDDRLYEALVLTFRRLGETVQDFQLLVKDWQKGKIRVGL